MNPASGGMYRVVHACTEAELLALEEPWNTLLTDMPQASVFLTWEWMSTWWRHFGEDRELWLLTAWDEFGRLAGLAPWMLTFQRLGPVNVRRIRFIGSGLVCSDHLDVIARPEDQESVCAALVTYLQERRRDWDIIDLEGLAQDSRLKYCLTEIDGHHHENSPITCPYVSLPHEWDTYYQHLSRKLRRNLKYYQNRLEREHSEQAVLRQVADAGEVPAAMDSLVTLHRKRWREKGIVTSFEDARFVDFHREMATLALKRGWLRLFQLQLGDQTIAAAYRFRYRDVYYAYQTAFDPDWFRYGPGNLMTSHVVQQAIQEGAREFDWCRGPEEYKSSWGSKVRADSHLLLSTSWRGHLSLAGAKLADAARSIGRRLLSPSIRRKFGRFLTRGRW